MSRKYQMVTQATARMVDHGGGARGMCHGGEGFSAILGTSKGDETKEVEPMAQMEGLMEGSDAEDPGGRDGALGVEDRRANLWRM